MNNIILTGKIKKKPRYSLYKSNTDLPVDIVSFILIRQGNDSVDVFPVVAFDALANSILANYKEGDVVNIEGCVRDYNYEDCNHTKHFSKVLVASNVANSSGENDKENKSVDSENDKLYNFLVKENINLFSISEFEEVENCLAAMR